MPTWLKNAVFYEIYPQSFYDTNGDGIGDIEGIIQKLDYIRELRCNALWINPWYDSPFMDAGYDVRDYKKVAERYGSNEDAYRLFEEAHKKGIHVVLDLVPGHTSDQHPWFLTSKLAEKNEYTSRYVWTRDVFPKFNEKPFMSGMSEREGAYMLNFFASQPALNYGWGKVTEDWMDAADSAEAAKTKEAMKEVIRFWLDHGADGFRCDMADYLVKNDDEKKSGTSAIWAEIRQMLDQDYPEAVLISEWSNPKQAINQAGFHMDFYLNHPGNGYFTLLRDYEHDGADRSYFKKDSQGDIYRFLDDWMPKYEATKEKGYISLITCNHDTKRARHTLSIEELKIAYAFLLTMPGIPFIYYGDEIGMRYQPNLNSKEGGYQRTGSRTPMQWNNTKNLGFSSAEEDALYLPVDHQPDAPTVQAQKSDENSLYSCIRELLSLRSRYEDLQADADFELIYAVKGKRSCIYRRGNLILAMNPGTEEEEVLLSQLADRERMFTIGKVQTEGLSLKLGSGSFAIWG